MHSSLWARTVVRQFLGEAPLQIKTQTTIWTYVHGAPFERTKKEDSVAIRLKSDSVILTTTISAMRFFLLASVVAIRNSAAMRTTEAHLLERASKFVSYRHLGYESIVELFTRESVGYSKGTNIPSSPLPFIAAYQFPFPIESIQASTSSGKYRVDIKYEPGLLFSRETLHFDPALLKITSVDTICTDGDFDEKKFVPRIHVCGGADDENSVRALKAARILALATDFLKADVTQDLQRQSDLLADDAVAFGVKGRDEIIAAQKSGIEGGTTYSLPYPLQVNTQSVCVSLDFLAHKNDSQERGTDILYVDLRNGKIVRIDTLRHTQQQPLWVKKHFSM